MSKEPSHSNRPDSAHVLDDLAGLHRYAADAFCELANRTLKTSDTFRVSLSGGSTPKGLYEQLAGRSLPWNRIHWYWGDERNVPPDNEASNQKMVREALLQHVDVPEENIHAVEVDVTDPDLAAMRYEQSLHRTFSDQLFPTWDLVLLGMGDDAHTASLFPDTRALDEQERWFVANWVSKFEGYRYTLTAPAINSGREIWFLVAGEKKREALQNVWSPKQRPHQYPSQFIRPTRWLLTRDAVAD